MATVRKVDDRDIVIDLLLFSILADTLRNTVTNTVPFWIFLILVIGTVIFFIFDVTQLYYQRKDRAS